MKAIKFFLVISSIFLITHACAEEQTVEEIKPLKETNPISTDKTLITEEQTAHLDFDKLRENATEKANPLSPMVNEETDLQCINCLRLYTVMSPLTQGLDYIRGELCHIGNYPDTTIITVLEGRNYGLQTIVDYYGYVLSVNYNYVIEQTPAGVTFHHAYPDCTVVTGLNQMIIFN